MIDSIDSLMHPSENLSDRKYAERENNVYVRFYNNIYNGVYILFAYINLPINIEIKPDAIPLTLDNGLRKSLLLFLRFRSKYIYKHMYLLYNAYVSNYKSKNRRKYLLQYHLILVCKYRKKLFINSIISNDIKDLSTKICDKYNITVKYMETDKDHIHYMLEIPPVITISKAVRLIKSYTTYQKFIIII